MTGWRWWPQHHQPAALLHALAGAKVELLTLLECRADEAAERAAIQAEPPLPTNGTAERDRQDKAQRVILAGLLTVAGWPKSQRGTLGAANLTRGNTERTP